jgi:transposase
MSIDLFNADWKIPYQYVIEEKFVNHGWARLSGSHWRDSLDMSLSEWIPRWFDRVYYRYRIVIIMTFLSMLVYIPITALRLRRQRGWTNTREILYLIGCIGVIYWFTNAPDPRFGWGFIFIAFIIPVAPLIQPIVVRFKAVSCLCMLAVLTLHTLNQSYISIQATPKMTSVFFSPVPYPTEELWSERIGNIIFYGARTGDCWDAPLRCIPILNDQIHPRGDNLESGFRITRTEAVR